MPAETNLITTTELEDAKVREIDFVEKFAETTTKLIEALGVTRKMPKSAGVVLKTYKATGRLVNNGTVPEGEVIPLSQYEVEATPVGEIALKKWRKSTSAEAIAEHGMDNAVAITTNKMLKDVQKAVRTNFFNFLATGEGEAEGVGLQKTLANTWGVLQTLFEDDAIETVYFANPTDVAEYLGSAQITTQDVFGMKYVENFLGLGSLFVNASVPAGKVYATAKDNVVLAYIPANAGFDGAFEFTTDETGYIGIHEAPDYNNLTSSDTVISGMQLFAERIDGVVVADIKQGE